MRGIIKVSVVFITLTALAFTWFFWKTNDCPDYAQYTFEYTTPNKTISAEPIKVSYNFYFHKETTVFLPENIFDAITIRHGVNNNELKPRMRFLREVIISKARPLKFELTFRKHPSKNGVIIDELGEKLNSLRVVVLEFNTRDKCPSWMGVSDSYLISTPFEY